MRKMKTALSERSRATSEAVSEMPEQQFLVVEDYQIKGAVYAGGKDEVS
jgi:hypothetical protein